MIKKIVIFLLIMLGVTNLSAQIKGVVVDAETGDPIPYMNIYYDGKGVGTITDVDGNYSIKYVSGWNKLTFSMVGYATQVIAVNQNTRTLNVKMKSDMVLSEVVIKPKKEKYSRKNNPAVELMKKVVEAKKMYDLAANDYYQYNKYQKITFSLNNVTPDSVKQNKLFQRYPFLEKQIEVCDVTGKNILPISVDETASEVLYRKNPESKKTLIKGVNSSGVNELFNTGDMLMTALKDYFQDINIYEDRFRFLQYPFDSPISSAGIDFYKYYIMDTTYVDADKCFHLTFVPNNSRDFGFTGHLYVMADSTFRVKKCIMNLPKKTDINFVDHMVIRQQFGALANGGWVLTEDDMLCELSYLKKVFGSYQIRRITKYSDFEFLEIPERIFKQKGDEIKDFNAMMRDETFWEQYRPEKLTYAEGQMNKFVDNLQNIKGFKYILFGAKALIENSIETGAKSKVDIMPINTMITSNYIDGLRLRASAQTTAYLNPKWFFKGYYAYGFKDQRSKYMGEVEYSFKPRAYSLIEFPKQSLRFTYQYDNMLPSDKFVDTDKDNVFTALKVTHLDQYNYERKATLQYEHERENGFKTFASLRIANYEPCGELFYRTMENESRYQAALETSPLTDRRLFNTHDISVSEASVGIRYAPGETFINTKQRRIPVNFDAPVMTLQHTFGLKGVLGSEYNYNFTEATVYKRFWVPGWGKLDINLRGGIQWDKVPFPLLIMPAANLSYILHPHTFNLINNMEFLNDRYASLEVDWTMMGRVFNKIPLIRNLKWREYVGFKMLWGTLTDKNNPNLPQNANDPMLMMFPGHYDANGRYISSSYVMDPKIPYMEVAFGVHNILKLLHVEYVRRINYLNLPTANKWGIRLMVRTVF